MDAFTRSSSQRLSREHERLLQPLAETATRLIANAFSSWLQAAVGVMPGALCESTYGVLRDPARGDDDVLVVFDCSRSRDVPEGIMTLPRALIDVLIDRLMGGSSGREAYDPRPLTDFDRAMAMKVAGKILEGFDAALEDPTISLEGTARQAETDVRMLPQTQPPTERYLTVALGLRLPEPIKTLYTARLALPLTFLRPLVRGEAEEPQRDPSAAVDRCALVPLEVQAEFAHRSVTLKEMLNLQPGATLWLPARSLQTVVVRIEGEPRLMARPGMLGDRVVLEITGMLTEEEHAELFAGV